MLDNADTCAVASFPPTDGSDDDHRLAIVTLRHTAAEHQRTKDAAHYRRVSMNVFVRWAVREATELALEARDEETKRADGRPETAKAK
jgi:hypothetical protein